MDITKEIIHNLSRSSSIHLTEEETASFQQDLEKILTYVESLNEVNTSTTKPLVSPIFDELSNVIREDIPTNSQENTQELLLDNAPEQVANMIRVPSIL